MNYRKQNKIKGSITTTVNTSPDLPQLKNISESDLEKFQRQ